MHLMVIGNLTHLGRVSNSNSNLINKPLTLPPHASLPSPPLFFFLQVRLDFTIKAKDVDVAIGILEHVMKKDVGAAEDEDDMEANEETQDEEEEDEDEEMQQV